LYSVYGSYVPFARENGTARVPGDRRPSFEARYANEQGWREALLAAAAQSVESRWMLHEDLNRLAAQLDRQGDVFHII
jgi:hypothetical protein